MTVARAVLFLALGVMVGGIVAHVVTGSAWYAFAWGFGAVIALVVGIVVLVLRYAGGASDGAEGYDGRRGGRLISIGAAVLGILAVLLPSIPALLAGPQAGGAHAPTSSDLRVGNGPKTAVAAMVASSGQSKFTEFDFRVDYVTGTGLSGAGATTSDLWDYRHGQLIRVGLGSSEFDDPNQLFDARGLDFDRVGTAVHKAVALTGMHLTADTYVIVERASNGDGPSGLGSPTIEVLFDDGSRTARVTYNFDLSIVGKSGSMFEG